MNNELSQPEYIDLEIRILQRRKSGYPVELTVDGTPHVAERYLSGSIRQWVPGVSATTNGEDLFERLFADDELKKAWANVQHQHPFRRVRLRIDEGAAELHTVPWELLRETRSGSATHTLAADAGTPFSRYLVVPGADFAPQTADTLDLLVALANPENLAARGLDQLDLAAEQHALRGTIADIPTDRLRLTFLEQPVTLAALEAALHKRYHLLHIVAHGRKPASPAPGQPSDAVLFLADDDNQVKTVSETEVAEMFKRLKQPPQVVFLASCQTAAHSSADAFRGFAPALIRAEVPAVIAMQDLVPVETARAFANTFYQRLLTHGQVDVASNEARSRLLTDGHIHSWGIPVLYSRVPDGLVIIPPAKVNPTPTLRDRLRRHRSLAIAIGGIILTILITIGDLLGFVLNVADLFPAPAPTIVAMPKTGFNIAVATFTMQTPTGSITTTESAALSNWLFGAIQAEVSNIPSSLAPAIRSPQEIGLVSGQSTDERTVTAAAIATQHNATMLVYGVIEKTDLGYAVLPEFYIGDPSSRYGTEITGPTALGKPIPFSLPLDELGTGAGNNPKLFARTQALQAIINGLAHLYQSHPQVAAEEFEQAAAVPGWDDDAGKEVAFMLKGAAKLQSDNLETPVDERTQILQEAFDAFDHARQLNEEYARSYLGLGSVALQQTTLLTSADPSLIEDKLIEASEWFTRSLEVENIPPTAFIEAKAQFGIGQVYLKAFEQKLPNWSLDQALMSLSEVIAIYEQTQSPPRELRRIAAHAHSELGWIAGQKQDWPQMEQEYAAAIRILSNSSGNLVSKHQLTAFYWSGLGFARREQHKLEAAKQAYRQAIAEGEERVKLGDIHCWQLQLEHLEKGETQRVSCEQVPIQP